MLKEITLRNFKTWLDSWNCFDEFQTKSWINNLMIDEGIKSYRLFIFLYFARDSLVNINFMNRY